MPNQIVAQKGDTFIIRFMSLGISFFQQSHKSFHFGRGICIKTIVIQFTESPKGK